MWSRDEGEERLGDEYKMPFVKIRAWPPFLLVAIPLLNAAISFAEGVSGRFWMVLMPPVQALLLLFAIVLIGLVVLSLFKTIFAQQDRRFRRVILLSSALVVFFAMLFTLPSGGFWFLQGFKFGLLQRFSLDELNEIAAVARQVVPEGSLILPADIGSQRGEPDNAQRWSDFISRVPVKHLNPRFVVYNRDGEIQIEWGGALTGHWGLRIGNTVSRGDRDTNFIPMSVNVAAYTTD